VSSDNGKKQVRISYFSDVLCIWAYVGEARLRELQRTHGDQLEMVYRFIQVFGHVPEKMERVWGKRGGPAAYRDHVLGVAADFPQVDVHPEIWTRNIPASSAPAHTFIKAVDLACKSGQCPAARLDHFEGRNCVEEAAWRVRLAFFRDLKDVSHQDVLLGIAADMELPTAAIRAHLQDGTAAAELCFDQARKEHHNVTGSPTYVLNKGRQKLFGNVGYRIIEANVDELLQDNAGRLSWC